MKIRYTIILGLGLSFSATYLIAQSKSANHLLIPYFDPASQSNIVVSVCDFKGGQPCPLIYTNIVSNTNLFTSEEQQLLNKVFVKYKNVTTNSGPSGTVLASLCKTNLVNLYRTNEFFVALFQYTNSAEFEKVWFFEGHISAASTAEAGGGYTVGIGKDGSCSVLRFNRKKNGLNDGIMADIYGDHLQTYGHYTNGMAIGKYIVWNPQNNNLMLEAEFKEPYDFAKNRLDLHMPKQHK